MSNFAIFVFAVSINCLVAPDFFDQSCTSPPNDNNFKTVVFQANQGVLLSCNKANLVYPKIPSPEDNSYGRIVFASYSCVDGKWKNDDIYYSNKLLRCVKGCPYPAFNREIHVTSDHETCALLNEEEKGLQFAYIHCDIRCENGYYADSKAKNQLSNQRVYCKETNGESHWEINTGTDLEAFVKCLPGCRYYGSDRENTYGMIGNFKSLGDIRRVKRYAAGEVTCDTRNGFVVIAKELKRSLVLTCESGDHWEPVNPDYYCAKGCRKPGGKFGGEEIEGYSFGCSDGENGWYIVCAFSCNSEKGYTMVGRSGRLPNGPLAESVRCHNGSFDLTNTQNACEIECGRKSCPAGYSCTGYVYDFKGVDTGKRYCVEVPDNGSGQNQMTDVIQSYTTFYMMEIFGGYDWLKMGDKSNEIDTIQIVLKLPYDFIAVQTLTMSYKDTPTILWEIIKRSFEKKKLNICFDAMDLWYENEGKIKFLNSSCNFECHDFDNGATTVILGIPPKDLEEWIGVHFEGQKLYFRKNDPMNKLMAYTKTKIDPNGLEEYQMEESLSRDGSFCDMRKTFEENGCGNNDTISLVQSEN